MPYFGTTSFMDGPKGHLAVFCRQTNSNLISLTFVGDKDVKIASSTAQWDLMGDINIG